MPLKDGYGVLDEMRRGKFLYHVPVVVITAEDSTDNRVKVFELGASDDIAKPFEPEALKASHIYPDDASVLIGLIEAIPETAECTFHTAVRNMGK